MVKNVVSGVDSMDNRINVHWMTFRNEKVLFFDLKTDTLEQQSDFNFDRYVDLLPTNMVDLKVLPRRQKSNLTFLSD